MSSTKIELKVRGLDRVLGTIDALNGKLLVGVSDVIKNTGEDIANEAKGYLYNGRGVDTGKYQKSIKSKFDQNKTTARIAGWNKGRPHPLGHILELGTEPHQLGEKGGQHPGTDPIPHLEPAFQTGVARLETRLKFTIRALA